MSAPEVVDDGALYKFTFYLLTYLLIGGKGREEEGGKDKGGGAGEGKQKNGREKEGEGKNRIPFTKNSPSASGNTDSQYNAEWADGIHKYRIKTRLQCISTF